MVRLSVEDESWIPLSDTVQFSLQLLPKYFKHNNFSSFTKQLNTYRFNKIGTDFKFANDGFIRGQPELMKNIAINRKLHDIEKRKSPQQKENSDQACLKKEICCLWKEVENLKQQVRQHKEQMTSFLAMQTPVNVKVSVVKKPVVTTTSDSMESSEIKSGAEPNLASSGLLALCQNYASDDDD